MWYLAFVPPQTHIIMDDHLASNTLKTIVIGIWITSKFKWWDFGTFPSKFHSDNFPNSKKINNKTWHIISLPSLVKNVFTNQQSVTRHTTHKRILGKMNKNKKKKWFFTNLDRQCKAPWPIPSKDLLPATNRTETTLPYINIKSSIYTHFTGTPHGRHRRVRIQIHMQNNIYNNAWLKTTQSKSMTNI